MAFLGCALKKKNKAATIYSEKFCFFSGHKNTKWEFCASKSSEKEHYAKDYLRPQHGKLDSGGILEQMVWVYHRLRPQTEACFMGEEKRESVGLVSGLESTRAELAQVFKVQRIFSDSLNMLYFSNGLPWWFSQWRIHLQHRRLGFDPWVGKIPWRRAWQPTPVFLHGESPWTEEPGGLQPMKSQRAGHNWATKHSMAHFYNASSYFWYGS